MTYRTVGNQTVLTVQRSTTSQGNETQKGSEFTAVENSPNWAGFTTVPSDGTPIAYKAHEHRKQGEAQYNSNPV